MMIRVNHPKGVENCPSELGCISSHFGEHRKTSVKDGLVTPLELGIHGVFPELGAGGLC